jgi:hypothetical protein
VICQACEIEGLGSGSLGTMVHWNGGGRGWYHYMRYARPAGCRI